MSVLTVEQHLTAEGAEGRRGKPSLVGFPLRPFASSAVLALILLAATSPAQPPRRDTAMINRSANPLLASFRFRSIGPASMGGRVDDIEVAPSDQNVIYVGYAAGGVWKS